MALIWLITAGVVASVVAKLLMPGHGTGGLFVLGLGGSIIAGMMQYSLRAPISFLGGLVGAAALLSLHALTTYRDRTEKPRSKDVRKAA
jgi:uncharacterized membrane protein YeaQ/YmgE (transglycosylase-associated protein family)